MKLIIISQIALLATFSSFVNAKNIGVVGHVFPIAEIDMLQWIDKRLATYQATGKLDELKENFQNQVKETVKRPAPLGLETTVTPRTFTVDPTLILAKDIIDHKGTVIYPKGTRINPFDLATWPKLQQSSISHFSFSKTLIFFNGDDKQQVEWAKRYQEQYPNKSIKWILTEGEPANTQKQLQARIYFDQQGNITRKLAIQYVPSVVEQKDTLWQVQEIDVSDIEIQEQTSLALALEGDAQ
ncbi:type-F conjugative transfer system protein TraW [uncultured Shewanella sp.]|uniref:type-F conjugative transfer system protein TraW n=1 Tax=uncultured Shewanella sp. TaxID=173975 RepID=UPI0026043EAB|nr:type-F conjugative transfer system protein TraW [uncultured Shewanella sp.]